MSGIASPAARAKLTGMAAGGVALACALLCGQLSASRWFDRTETPPRQARPAVASRRPDRPITSLTVTMLAHESLADALARGGLAAEQARRASAALADDFDTVNPHPGLALFLTMTGPERPGAPPRLAALSLAPGEDRRLTLSSDEHGVMRLGRQETTTTSAATMASGAVQGSLYLSLVGQGASPDMAARIEALFGRRLDLARDVESGDRFRFVLEQRRGRDGAAAGPLELLYAELATHAGRARIYRVADQGERLEVFIDGQGGPGSAPLLRTPVAGARVSSPFGLRFHPILGFTRMHQGVDFAAPRGSPVLAAGDGVIEEARWAGGYGRWLKIRHDADLETGYAHLSAWAAGIAPGARVRQGQVVGYVGATGLATGPHLHFEVFKAGRRVDPASLATRTAKSTPADTPAFLAQKASMDARVRYLDAECADAPAQFSLDCGG